MMTTRWLRFKSARSERSYWVLSEKRGGTFQSLTGPHNNYYLWGPGTVDPKVVIVIGGSLDVARRMFREVRAGGRIVEPNAMPFENNLTIWVCTEPRAPLREMWDRLKHYV